MKLSKIAKREEFEDFTILIGRNAKMNDLLTLEVAQPEDLWLHAAGVPGSHIVIQNPEGKEIPKEVIQYAAQLAAKNSKGQGKVKVVASSPKNITKHPQMPAGKVQVDYKQATIYLTQI